jgi:hypothetical protein
MHISVLLSFFGKEIEDLLKLCGFHSPPTISFPKNLYNALACTGNMLRENALPAFIYISH